jgi:hypothetical protein
MHEVSAATLLGVADLISRRRNTTAIAPSVRTPPLQASPPDFIYALVAAQFQHRTVIELAPSSNASVPRNHPP